VTYAFYGAVYFLPAIAGWLVAKFTGAPLPLQRLFVVNALVGWTGIGWIACWPYLIVLMIKAGAIGTSTGGGGSSAAGTSSTSYTAPPMYQQPEQRQPCGSCGGSGRTTCWSCGGQGGQWRQPVTATDTASWVACGSCMSGKVTCTSCNGSGYAW
jgi:hypothetical protein